MSGLSNLAAISTALSQRFARPLARQYNRMAVLGGLIGSDPGFGKNVAWDVEFDGATASSYQEGSDVQSSEFNVDVLQPAVLSWGHYRSAFSLSETQINAAMSSQGSADAILRIVLERVLSSGRKLASVINQDMWNGTGTDGSGNPNIVGLLGGSLDATGNYAGLSRSTYSGWAGNVLANGGVARALSIDLLEQMFVNIFRASGTRPNAIVGDPDVIRKYSGLLEPARHIVGGAQGPLNRYDTSTADYFFKGIPVLADKDGYTGTLAFLNTDLIRKVFLPEEPEASMDASWMEMVEGEGSNGLEGENKEENPLDLPFKVVALAKTGDSVKLFVKSVLNVKVERPNAFGLLKDISVT